MSTLLLPRTMRPLPTAVGAAGVSEGRIADAPISILRGPPGSFVPERLAGSITSWDRWRGCVWLRAPNSRPESIADALTAACRHRWGSDSASDDRQDRPSNEALTDTIRESPPDAVVVLELRGRIERVVARLLADLRPAAADHGVSVITVSETRIPSGWRLDPYPRIRMAELTDPRSIGGGQLSATHRGRLTAIAGHRAAVVQDVLDATAIWPGGAVSDAVDDSYLCRTLLDRLTAALLRLCEPAQLEALEVCLATGYWHPRLGTHPMPAAQLRPWVVPLEHEWGWLRPIWGPSLRRHLVDRPPNRVSSGESLPLRPPPVRALTVRPRPPSPASLSGPLVEARLLGTFEFRVDGVPVGTWYGQRGISVLRYLLMRDQLACRRDELLAEFWPDVRPESARNRLQVVVSGLRRALLRVTNLPVIDYADGSYRMSRAFRFSVDVKQFEAALRQARETDRSGDLDAALRAYGHAVAGYRGDFAADAPYEQWTLLPRESLRVGYIDALDRLAQLQFEAGDVDACIATGHRMLEVDPCREDAHRLLMRCYARQGRVYQAMRQYDFCFRILSATIDTPPTSQTTGLYRAIRAAGSLPELAVLAY